jgi:hypothetical protein
MPPTVAQGKRRRSILGVVICCPAGLIGWCYFDPFVLELVKRAWFSSVQSMGTTTLAIVPVILAYFIHVFSQWRQRRRLLVQPDRKRLFLPSPVATLTSLMFWLLLFSYHLFYKVPLGINEGFSRTNLPPQVRFPREEPPTELSVQPLHEQLVSVPAFQVSFTPQVGYTFTPHGGEVIDPDTLLKDRRQYALVLKNGSKLTTIAPVDLRMQLPYPIETYEVVESKDADGVVFQPIGMTLTVRGSGQVQVLNRPISPDYKLRISDLQPGGQVKVLCVLNSWRDPRGKSIPKGEGVRYSIPEWGPTLTYISGHFDYHLGSQMIKREFYAPVQLSEDKTVSLGPPSKRPVGLFEAVNMQ